MEPEKNVYIRKDSIDDSEHDDVWDDELLIKAYNKSVNGVKQKIAQRIGIINGVPENTSEEQKVCKTNSPKVRSGSKKGQSKKKWEIGDYCRAVYSEDGLEYEAQIKKFFSDGKCVVKYYGYLNEEVVKIKDLKKSLGENSRIVQEQAACNRLESEDSQISEDSKQNISVPMFSGSIPAVPPPPAFALTSQLNKNNESDALSAMLMSWYMSGYHTGYYQGLMQAKNQYKKSSSDHN